MLSPFTDDSLPFTGTIALQRVQRLTLAQVCTQGTAAGSRETKGRDTMHILSIEGAELGEDVREAYALLNLMISDVELGGQESAGELVESVFVDTTTVAAALALFYRDQPKGMRPAWAAAAFETLGAVCVECDRITVTNAAGHSWSIYPLANLLRKARDLFPRWVAVDHIDDAEVLEQVRALREERAAS